MMVKFKRQKYELPIEEDEEEDAVEEHVSTLARDQPMSEVVALTMKTPAGSPHTVAIEDLSEVDLPKHHACNHPATQAINSTTQDSGHDAQPESSIPSFEQMFGYTNPSIPSPHILEESVAASPSPSPTSENLMETLQKMPLTSVYDVVNSSLQFNFYQFSFSSSNVYEVYDD